jgi:hypothetical protein
MGYQVLIRENGGEPRWIDIEKVFGRTRTVKTYSPSPPTLKEVDGFEEWWKLFDYKKSKSKAKVSWKRHVKNKELVEVIMNHTKQYVASTPDKQYRKHPTTYLNGHSWNDEITKQEVKVDLDQMYPLDKTGNARLGRCSKCNAVVFANKFNVLNEDSSCCKVKIKQYR